MNKVDLSIAVTAHSEGLIAHKTMLSIFDAIKMLDNISYEIIVSIDSGTKDTLEYFNKLATEHAIRVLEVNFKDLSASRNNAVNQAKGKYVTFIDADDLMSANWLRSALEIISSNPRAVIHPEYSVTFGDDDLIWHKRNSGDQTADTLILVDNNLWDSPCLASRDVFINHPYHPNGNGFGYEDKKFNSDTLADDIKHVIAPNTLLFVRRKNEGSMLRGAIADKVTVAPTPLLSFDNIKSLDLKKVQLQLPSNLTNTRFSSAKHTARYALKKMHGTAMRYDSYQKIIKPLREMRQEKIIKDLKDTYPDSMIKLWKEMHRIDNTVFPSKALLKSLSWYNAENIVPGYKYAQLIQNFSHNPDTLFFVPHIIKGGADMVFINYANELQSKKNWKIAMLQTEAKLSVWKEKISKEIDFIDLYDHLRGLDNLTQQRLLATLVTQNGVKRIIVGNSQLAYDFIAGHSTLLEHLGVAIYCFAFGEEFDDEGRLWGHIHTGIPKIYPSIYRIITDNKNTVDKLEQEYALGRERFRIHYQPTNAAIHPPLENNHKPLKILWASRVCKQKRPDIIKKISYRLNPNEFIIEAWGQLEEGLTASYFDDSRITYKGPFNGSEKLPTSEYDIYIYTSEGDGVPNVLQEITAAGLPIIASNVGGIREFIQTGNTGYLVEDHENIDEYIKAVHEFSDSRLRILLNSNAQKLLTTKFSRDSWLKSISSDFDK